MGLGFSRSGNPSRVRIDPNAQVKTFNKNLARSSISSGNSSPTSGQSSLSSILKHPQPQRQPQPQRLRQPQPQIPPQTILDKAIMDAERSKARSIGQRDKKNSSNQSSSVQVPQHLQSLHEKAKNTQNTATQHARIAQRHAAHARNIANQATKTAAQAREIAAKTRANLNSSLPANNESHSTQKKTRR